jgi:hypothetical protein
MERAGWREKEGKLVNSMHHTVGMRKPEAVEHQTSRVTGTDDGKGHVLKKGG